MALQSWIILSLERGGLARHKQRYAVILFLLLIQSLYGFDIKITGAELGLNYIPEYNRVFHYCWDIASFGSLELNNMLTFKGGIALGQTGRVFDIHAFGSSEAALPLPVHLYVKVAYIYNGIPDYNTGIHSLLPTLSLRGKWAGISVGPALRFTTFGDEPAVFEPIIAFSGFVNLIYTDPLRIGIGIANYSDFVSGNMGSYSINLNSLARLTKKISLVNELEVLQNGSVGLVSNFYGIVYKGGLLLQW
ncbi:MAG: hypothetical protein LBT14_13325 [Treponema sp.]|jgi:hypothetical protein|nr:hypothetical protein [Treponema sp.]